mgnify:CR=1 FL=1
MKKDEIKQKRPFAPGIQWQLMLFIGGITLFTLLLVWGIITYALEPQYNRNIRAKLDSKAAAITALIDQSDAEISSRTYQGLYLNDEFWSGVSQTFRDKKINVDGNCVDFSDSTLRCLKAYESMYPCLLHESTGAFGGAGQYELADSLCGARYRDRTHGPLSGRFPGPVSGPGGLLYPSCAAYSGSFVRRRADPA